MKMLGFEFIFLIWEWISANRITTVITAKRD